MTQSVFRTVATPHSSPGPTRSGVSRSPNDALAGIILSAGIVALILVPILQKALVGGLSRVVPAGLIAGALLVVLLRGFWAGRGFARRPVAGLFLLGYLVVMFGSTYVAPDLAGPSQSQLQVIVGLSVAVLALYCTDAERMIVVRTIVVAAGLEGAWAVFEAVAQPGALWGYSSKSPLGLPVALSSQIFDGAIRAQGTLGHPLILAFLMLVGIGLAIGFRPLLWRRWVDVVAIAVMVGGIFAAGSRSGLAIAAVLILFSARKAIPRLAWGALALVGVLSVLTLAGFWESTVVTKFFASDSLSHRTSSATSFSSLLRNQDTWHVLFGNGFWSTVRLYMTGVLPSAGNFYAVDNQFISTLAGTGVLGLLALLAMIGWAFWRGAVAMKWAIFASLAMWWTFEVIVWPVSYALLISLVCLASPLRVALPVARPVASAAQSAGVPVRQRHPFD